MLLATLFIVVGGIYAVLQDAARRAARPVRRAGHHLHRVPRPGAAGGRGPGHLSADHGDAGGAEVQGGARLLVLRRVVRLRHLRGRHRHLLGALAGAGVPQLRLRPPAARASRRSSGRTPPASAGSTSTRCWRKNKTLAELRTHPGLVPALPADQGAGRGRGGQRRRLRPAVPGRSSIRASCSAYGIPLDEGRRR